MKKLKEGKVTNNTFAVDAHIAYKVCYYGEFVKIMVSYLDFQKLNFVAFTKLW